VFRLAGTLALPCGAGCVFGELTVRDMESYDAVSFVLLIILLA
jgi:hypothetical protein